MILFIILNINIIYIPNIQIYHLHLTYIGLLVGYFIPTTKCFNYIELHNSSSISEPSDVSSSKLIFLLEFTPLDGERTLLL